MYCLYCGEYADFNGSYVDGNGKHIEEYICPKCNSINTLDEFGNEELETCKGE